MERKIENPCEAETFDEAFWKNKARYDIERRESAALYAEMLAEKDPRAEGMRPDFWIGCIQANKEAYTILQSELREARKRAAEQIKALENKTVGKSFQSGYVAVRGKWTEAILADDPSIIVYW